jgi:hypothetical protein
MLGRDHGAADGVALELAGFDQPRGVVARRIAEYRAGVRLIERLRRDPPLQQIFDLAA